MINMRLTVIAIICKINSSLVWESRPKPNEHCNFEFPENPARYISLINKENNDRLYTETEI